MLVKRAFVKSICKYLIFNIFRSSKEISIFKPSSLMFLFHNTFNYSEMYIKIFFLAIINVILILLDAATCILLNIPFES